MAQRRATIFAFFCAFSPDELADLVDLVLGPLAAVGATTPSASPKEARARAAALARLRPAQLLGVLRSLHDAVAQLGGSLTRFLPQLSAASHLLLYATHCVCQMDGSDEEAHLLPADSRLDPATPANLDLIQAREARLWSMKLLALYLQAFSTSTGEELAPLMSVSFHCLTPMLKRLHTHYTQSPAGLLSVLLVIALQPATIRYFELSPVPVLPCVYAALAAPKCAKPVVETILSLVEALLDLTERRSPKAAASAAALAKVLTEAEEEEGEGGGGKKKKKKGRDAEDDEDEGEGGRRKTRRARKRRVAAVAQCRAARLPPLRAPPTPPPTPRPSRQPRTLPSGSCARTCPTYSTTSTSGFAPSLAATSPTRSPPLAGARKPRASCASSPS